MSAAGRSAVRDELDRYDTPRWAVLRLIEAGPSCLRHGGRWLEPSAGAGAIYDAVESEPTCDRGPREWTLLDIAPRRAGIIAEDFLAARFDRPFDVVIGNPPYRLADEFARRAVGLAPVVAFLLRLSWLASAKRADWLREHTPSVYVLPNRPSFTGKGTDATDYAWFVWGTKPGHVDYGPTVEILATTPASERRKGAGSPGSL